MEVSIPVTTTFPRGSNASAPAWASRVAGGPITAASQRSDPSAEAYFAVQYFIAVRVAAQPITMMSPAASATAAVA